MLMLIPTNIFSYKLYTSSLSHIREDTTAKRVKKHTHTRKKTRLIGDYSFIFEEPMRFQVANIASSRDFALIMLAWNGNAAVSESGSLYAFQSIVCCNNKNSHTQKHT